MQKVLDWEIAFDSFIVPNIYISPLALASGVTLIAPTKLLSSSDFFKFLTLVLRYLVFVFEGSL